MRQLVSKHKEHDWADFYHRLLQLVARYGSSMQTVSMLEIWDGLDVGLVIQVARCCKGLRKFEISVGRCHMQGAQLKEVQDALWELCANNECLNEITIRNVNLSRESYMNRLQVHLCSIFCSGQAAHLLKLTITTLPDKWRSCNCPPHIPALSMSSMKNLNNLKVLKVGAHDLDVNTVQCLHEKCLQEVVVLCEDKEQYRLAQECRKVLSITDIVQVSIVMDDCVC